MGGGEGRVSSPGRDLNHCGSQVAAAEEMTEDQTISMLTRRRLEQALWSFRDGTSKIMVF